MLIPNLKCISHCRPISSRHGPFLAKNRHALLNNRVAVTTISQMYETSLDAPYIYSIF